METGDSDVIRTRPIVFLAKIGSSQHGDPAADQIVRGPSGGCGGDLISTPDSGYYRVF